MSKMAAEAVRTWLGVYTLCLAVIVGALLLLGGALLPLEEDQISSAFQIVVPFLLTQVAVVFRYYTSEKPGAKISMSLPAWLVKLPIILITLTLILAFGIMIAAGATQATWVLSPSQFHAVLTFCVSVLSVTSVLIMSKYFEASKSPPTEVSRK